MALIKQSSSYVRTFLMVGTSDHITGQVAAAPKLNISQAGGALSSTNAVIAELGVGLYTASLTSTDTRTLGDLLYHLTGTSADPADFSDQVVPDVPGATIQIVINPVTSGTIIDKNGYTIAGTVTAGTVLDKTGYALSQAFPANFAALAILAGGQVGINWGNIAATAFPNILSGTTFNTSQTVNTPASGDPWATTLPGGYSAGQAGSILASRMSSAQTVVVGTNSDKTGYSLSQSFPANFASLAITGGGAVTVGTNSDKTGYSLNSSQTTVTIGTVNTVTGTVTVGTNNDKTGYALTPQERGSIVSSSLSTVMTQGYAALGAAPNLAQILFEMRSHLTEKAINQTSVSLYQLDGATIWGAATLDSTSPTQIHRSA